jgi:hypothetical protein
VAALLAATGIATALVLRKRRPELALAA